MRTVGLIIKKEPKQKETKDTKKEPKDKEEVSEDAKVQK